MSRLNKSVVRRIYDALDSSVFTIGDFDIEFPETGQNLVVIRFIPAKAYMFLLIENQGRLFTREVPGEHRTSEDFRHDGFDDALRRIPSWCNNVKADLRASHPVYDDLEDLRKSLEEQVRQHVKDPEQHFSRQEADALKAKLDEVVAKFQELQEQKAITEAELKMIKDEVAELKLNVSSYSKGTFLRTTGNKLINLMKRVAKSDAAKEVLVASTKKFLELPPG